MVNIHRLASVLKFGAGNWPAISGLHDGAVLGALVAQEVGRLRLGELEFDGFRTACPPGHNFMLLRCGMPRVAILHAQGCMLTRRAHPRSALAVPAFFGTCRLASATSLPALACSTRALCKKDAGERRQTDRQ